MDLEEIFYEPDDYQITNEFIGSGQYGEVFVVKNLKDNKKYAIKKLKDNEDYNTKKLVSFLRESINLYKSSHFGVVKFYGISFKSISDKQKFEPSFIMDYYSNGSLKNILKNQDKDDKWNATQKYITLLGISAAMSHLHQQKLIHRDLKPDNILIDDDYYPRITDFGQSKYIKDELSDIEKTTDVGSPLYRAPEILDGYYDKSVDVFSFGIIAYEIVTGKTPYKNEQSRIRGTYDFLLKVHRGMRPKFKNNATPKMIDLISKCWSKNPKERPTFSEIFQKLSSDFSYSMEPVDGDEIAEYLNKIGQLPKIEENNEFEKEMQIKQKEIEANCNLDIIKSLLSNMNDLEKNLGKKLSQELKEVMIKNNVSCKEEILHLACFSGKLNLVKYIRDINAVDFKAKNIKKSILVMKFHKLFYYNVRKLKIFHNVIYLK